MSPQSLHAIVIEDAIANRPPFGPAYATAVFAYDCYANVLAGCDCRLTVLPWIDPSFPFTVTA